MKRRLLASLVPAALALLSGPVQADIYAFVDGNGVRHLSNVPSDPRYKLVMRTPTYRRESAQYASSFAPSNLYGSAGTAITPRDYYLQPRGSRTRLSRVGEDNRRRFTPDVNRIATQYRLEPALMHAVISAESSYNPWAVSPKGAMGLMQLMPGTAERFGVANPYDPIANMHGGARYLRWLLDRFNDPRLAVAAYNAGEGAVQKYGNQVPPYQETQTYVVRVLNYYQQYRTGGSYNTAYNAGYNAYAGAGYTTYASAGYGAGAQAMSSGYTSGTYSNGSGGVVVITPRTGNRPAVLTNRSAYSSATAPRPRTYLQPNGNRIIIGSSNTGTGVSRPAVKFNQTTQTTQTAAPQAAASLFAGNDK